MRNETKERKERKYVEGYLKNLEGRGNGEERVCWEGRSDGPLFPSRSPSDVFSIHIRRLSTNEGFERSLQDCRPIKVPFIVCHTVCPLPIFVHGTRGGTSDPLALDEPRSEIWPMSDWVEGLPPKSDCQPIGSERDDGQPTRNCGSGTRKSP